MIHTNVFIEKDFISMVKKKIQNMYSIQSNKTKLIKYRMPKILTSPTSNQNEIDCKTFYEMYKNAKCSYKNTLNGYVAGYLEHYIIIGFTANNGCIKSFNDHVEYDTSFVSYRLSKLKYITIFEDEKENTLSNT